MNEYIGSIGEKITAQVKLVGKHDYTDYAFSYRGTTHYIYTFKDEQENVLVWKTTSIMGFDIEERWQPIRKGDTISITGKIKSHDEYKETKQTVLTRCKYTLVEQAPDWEEIKRQRIADQLATVGKDDFVWEMPYKQYKEHYSDCETVIDSFEYEDGRAMIKVIIRAGRLKNSGVRGMMYRNFIFTDGNGVMYGYKAITEENARKQMRKEYPESGAWELISMEPYRNMYRYAI